MTSLPAPLALPDASALGQLLEAETAAASRQGWAVVGSIVALTLLAGLPGIDDGCKLMPDSFAYLDAARCLRETGGYSPFRMIHPPGYPTLLAPLLRFGDLPMLAVRLFNLACWIATSTLTYFLFRRPLGTLGAWMTAALTATSPALVSQSATLLSEPAFMPLVLGCLLLVDRWRDSSRLIAPITLGVLCSAATLVRTMGIVLAPIIAVAILSRPGRTLRHRVVQAVLFAIVFMAPMLAWELRQSAYPAGNSYGNAWLHARPWEDTNATGLALQWERLSHYGPLRLGVIKTALVPPLLGWRLFQGPIAPLASGLIGGAIIVVALWRCGRIRRPIEFFVLTTLAMLCFWPYDEGPRMVAPLLPMFFAYIVWVGQRAAHALPSQPFAGRLIGLAAAGILVAHLCELGFTRPALDHQRRKADATVAAIRRVRDWQDKNLPADASLACIIQPRQDVKTILLGGSYLSRRRMSQILDVPSVEMGDVAAIKAPYCFVQTQALGDAKLPSDGSHLGAVEGFEVFAHSVRITTP